MVDGTVSMAQLAQALAYQSEGVGRGQTDTLWMRRFGMRAAVPTVPIAGPLAGTGRVVRRKRLDRMGMSWRTYDLEGDFAGVHTFASLAFNVPDVTGRPVGSQDGAHR
jgi:hypothetical protein